MSATEQHGRQAGTSTKPDRWTRVRDGITFLGAWAIIGWQMLAVRPADVNETFLFLAAALLGVPFGAEALSRLRGGTSSASTPTTPPASPLPSSESPPSLPS